MNKSKNRIRIFAYDDFTKESYWIGYNESYKFYATSIKNAYFFNVNSKNDQEKLNIIVDNLNDLQIPYVVI